MSEFGDVSDAEMEEDWNDTRWAVPDASVADIQKEDHAVTDTTSLDSKDQQSKTDLPDQSASTENTVVPSAPGSVKEPEAPSVEPTKSASNSDDKQLMSRMALNDNKAGMQGLDKERINQIIFETSKGSRFYENELKREKQTDLKIKEQSRKMEALTESEIKSAEKKADVQLQTLEETRDLSRTIMHIDMDAFYAAVEMRDNPVLRHKPMAVGGSDMLSTSNYLARRYGVRAAMPGFIGKKLCPGLVIVPANFAKYTEVSHQVRDILKEYDPNFCPMSLDEAYLDLTDHLERRKDMSDDERTFVQVYTGDGDKNNENQAADSELEMLGVDVNKTVREGELPQKPDDEVSVPETESKFDEVLEHKNDNTSEVAVETKGQPSSEEADPGDRAQDNGGELRQKSESECVAENGGVASITDATLDKETVISEMNQQSSDADSKAVVDGENIEIDEKDPYEAVSSKETTADDAVGLSEENVAASTKENAAEEPAKVSDVGAADVEPSMQGTHVTFGKSAVEAVREIRFRIEQKTKLTASAGIAPNMMLSKVCSDKNKPNGQYYIPPNRATVMDFVNTLPIRKVPGIGKVAEKMLSALGVSTCADLHKKRGLIYHLYSAVSFKYFMQICLGIGSTKVERESERKSMSVERTFKEMSKPVELYKKLYELCDSLSEDLVSEHYVGKTVTIKLKTVEFELKTRGKTIANLTNEQTAIYAAARDLMRLEIQASEPEPLKLRLMGVRMSNLSRQEANTKKQSTITEMFASKRGSPHKHKLQPDNNSEQEALPAKRPRLEAKVSLTSKESDDTVTDRDVSPLTEVSDILSESADSETTDIYWPPNKIETRANKPKTPDNISESLSDGRPESCSVSLDEHYAKPQPAPADPDTTMGTKARDTPTTKALIKAQGSEPISCPVCAREFKSRNMNHITSHIERCLKEADQCERAAAESQDEESAGLFEDDCDELFSSRESQILLSQEVKESEPEVVEAEEDQVEEPGQQKNDVHEKKNVDDQAVEKLTEDEQKHDDHEAAEKVAEDKQEDDEQALDKVVDEKTANDIPEIEPCEEAVPDQKDNTIKPDAELNKSKGKEADSNHKQRTLDTTDTTILATSDELTSEVSELTADSQPLVQSTDDERLYDTGAESSLVQKNVANTLESNENGLDGKTPGDLLCPVCDIVYFSDLREFNSHVDRCLKKEELEKQNGSSADVQPQTSGTINVSQTPESSHSTKSGNESGISYLKNITPRRPLRTGPKNIKSPISGIKSLSAQSKTSGVKYTPIRSTITHRETHTSVSRMSSPEGAPHSIDDEETEMVCPLCNVALYNVSLVVFNQHVDGCLNRRTIRELIHEQDRTGLKRSEPASPENQPSNKKKRLSSSQPLSNPMKKIYSFFTKKP